MPALLRHCCSLPARTPLLWLMLTAFALQALVPLGYMPNLRASAGRAAITICHGDGLATILVDAPRAGDPAPQETPSNNRIKHTPCPFGAGIGFITALWLPILAISLVRYRQAAWPWPPLPAMRRLTFGNAAPRAPPAGLVSQA